MFEHHSQFQQINDSDTQFTRIYTLDRSPQYHLISKVIQHRRLCQQQKSYTSLTPTPPPPPPTTTTAAATCYLPRSKKNTTTIDTTCTAVENGLPSPPVDGHFKLTPTPSPSPSFTSTISTTTLPNITAVKEEQDSFVNHSNKNKLTKADICIKLQELRDEKHRLFQLIKQQLVLQEEQERRASQEHYIRQQHYIS